MANFQDKFVEVAYYSGAQNQLKKIMDFHWVKGVPPKDFPVCGWDHSKCPEGYPAHVYALIGAAILILFLAFGFFFFYRYFFSHIRSNFSLNQLLFFAFAFSLEIF